MLRPVGCCLCQPDPGDTEQDLAGAPSLQHTPLAGDSLPASLLPAAWLWNAASLLVLFLWLEGGNHSIWLGAPWGAGADLEPVCAHLCPQMRLQVLGGCEVQRPSPKLSLVLSAGRVLQLLTSGILMSCSGLGVSHRIPPEGQGCCFRAGLACSLCTWAVSRKRTGPLVRSDSCPLRPDTSHV